MGNKRPQRNEKRLDTFFQLLSLDINASPKSGSPACQRQLSRMRKRAEYHRPALGALAINEFINSNSLCAETNRTIDPSLPLFKAMRDFLLHVLTKFTKALDPDSLQECISQSWILDQWTFGPGTSNGCTGSGTVEKIEQPMSCTVSAESGVRLIRRNSPYFSAFDSVESNFGVLTVPGSRLTTVLKNEDSERTIAIEPSGNMALQLAGGRFIEGALRMLGINLSSQQPINQYLAYLYSKTGKGGTIDCKKCSDMFAIEFVRATWPAEWFNFFMKYRSPETQLPDGSPLTLSMISTMGNGFTFPMMTLTLVAVIYAVRRLKGGPHRFIDLRGTAVFGDDIIVPSADFDDVCTALKNCGLIVNTDKSFQSGPFRESCGGDFYFGENITPFYVKRLTNAPSIYTAINQMLRWCSRHEVVTCRSLRYLLSLLDGRVYFVPQWHSDIAGVRVADIPRNYKFLEPKPDKGTYQGFFTMPLACGGYLVSEKGRALYTPRAPVGAMRYESRKARLPSGYLDGWDPRYGTSKQTSWARLVIELAG